MTNLAASLHDYQNLPPGEVTSQGRTWSTRGANFVTCYSEVLPGATLARSEQPDESMMFSIDAEGTVSCAQETVAFSSGTLVIVPPGPSEVRCISGGRILRLFSSRDATLTASAGNAASYGEAAPGVAPLTPWPDPIDGFRLRTYAVADYARDGSRMRIFRSSNLMLNVMLPREGPRDTRTLSPHFHADFEQGSFAIEGQWVHHVRYPWTPDLAEWRDDEHLAVGSPSLLIVPPKAIHTSRNVGEGRAWLLDIFSPPRLDFSLKPGLICNGDSYPLPDGSVVA
ncbi:MAG: cupin domain-containing protein [Pigmentiphaga sp.]